MLGGAGADGQASGRPQRVLVVDDEPDLADLAQAMLGYHGFIVSVAYGAPDALRLLESDPRFDTVFSDIMMPAMTGVELAREINARYPHMRVVLTSGFTAPALMQHCHSSFIPKPYRIEQLVQLLRSQPLP